MFVWAKLPDALNAADVARHALEDNVVFAPGNVFSVSQSAGRFLRFNASQCNRPKVYEALQRAMDRAARPS
jgi:DNA-binding transcriptional MocR family regulator